jgi:hypothetical protein
MSLNRPVMSQGPAYSLDQFSHAYHVAQTTKIYYVVLNILYQADLAHLYDIYLGTLNALSGYTAQEEKIFSSRPREVFDDHVRSDALNKMY